MEYRRNAIGLQLAAVWQQDQFGRRRLPLAHAAGQGDQRLERVRNRRERRLHVGSRRLDLAADLLLLRCREQTKAADVLEIDADRIEIRARNSRLRPFARQPLGFEPVVFVLGYVLRRCRLGLFLRYQLVGRQRDRRIVRFTCVQRDKMPVSGAPMPVERFDLRCGLLPVHDSHGIPYIPMCPLLMRTKNDMRRYSADASRSSPCAYARNLRAKRPIATDTNSTGRFRMRGSRQLDAIALRNLDANGNRR